MMSAGPSETPNVISASFESAWLESLPDAASSSPSDPSKVLVAESPASERSLTLARPNSHASATVILPANVTPRSFDVVTLGSIVSAVAFATPPGGAPGAALNAFGSVSFRPSLACPPLSAVSSSDGTAVSRRPATSCCSSSNIFGTWATVAPVSPVHASGRLTGHWIAPSASVTGPVVRKLPPESSAAITTFVPGAGETWMPLTDTTPVDVSALRPSICSSTQHAASSRAMPTSTPAVAVGVAHCSVTGGTARSTSHVSSAGTPKFPARSTATIAKRCRPPASPRSGCGEEHTNAGPPSSWHSKRSTSAAAEFHAMSASGPLARPDGPDTSVVAGGVVSTVQVSASTGPARPAGRREGQLEAVLAVGQAREHDR